MPKIMELASVWIVLCAVDDDMAARRHLERGLANPEREFYHGDQRVFHYRQTGEFLAPAGYQVPKFEVPTIEVRTDGEYDPSIDEIVNQIRRIPLSNCRGGAGRAHRNSCAQPARQSVVV